MWAVSMQAASHMTSVAATPSLKWHAVVVLPPGVLRRGATWLALAQKAGAGAKPAEQGWHLAGQLQVTITMASAQQHFCKVCSRLLVVA